MQHGQIGEASTSRTLSPFCFSCSLVSPICIGLPSALIGSIHLRKTVIVTGVMMQLMAMISHSRSGSALQPAQSCSDQAPSKVLRIPIRESNWSWRGSGLTQQVVGHFPGVARSETVSKDRHVVRHQSAGCVGLTVAPHAQA